MKKDQMENIADKIGMYLGAVLSVLMCAVSPVHNDPIVVLNVTIGFVVMVICFIIWSSVRTDEDSESAEENKYFKRVIASNYAAASMANCVIVLNGDARYRILLYFFFMAVFFAFTMIFLSFGIYSLKAVLETSRKVKFYSRLYYIMAGIHLVLLLSTPISKIYFYIDENGYVQYSNTYSLVGIYALVIQILNLIWIIKNGKNKQKKQYCLVVFWPGYVL